MNRGKGITLMAAGILIGTVLAGPAAQAAEQIAALRSEQRIYVNGTEVQIEAYTIDGSNYVKLRDVGQAVGFNVYYDGAVQIESEKPYTGEAPVKEAANPGVFTELYTREAYNAVIGVLEGVRQGDLTRKGIVHIADSQDAQRFRTLIGYLSNGVCLNLRWTGQEGEYEVYASKADRDAADQAVDALIREVTAMKTDKEKVLRLNDWLCDRMVFNSNIESTVNEIAASPTPVEGNCSSFARMMSYLCGRAGIPCMRVYSENHCWNLIYADGVWSYTDASLNDQVSGHDALLLSPTARKEILDIPGTKFLQEILVPGSAK